MPSFTDHTGETFGRLTAIELVRTGKVWSYRCSCNCGSEVTVLSGNLTRKNKPTRSCGCLAVEAARKNKGERSPTYSHGHGVGGGTPTHRTWRSMKGRCLNHRNKDYRHYGGRGIKICDRWLSSFSAFLQDMGEKPDGMTLERVDNDGDYEPSNCRWATRYDQSRNTRRNRSVLVDGVEMCALDAAAVSGVDYFTLISRMDRGVSGATLLSPLRLRRGNR